MKKYSIIILLSMSMYLEVYFEKMFPFITVILGVLLGILLFLIEKSKDSQKQLITFATVLFYTVKYAVTFYLLLIFIVFLSYSRTSALVLGVNYSILIIFSITLVSLDLLILYKWYKNRSIVK